jgi:hypothetical protein
MNVVPADTFTLPKSVPSVRDGVLSPLAISTNVGGGVGVGLTTGIPCTVIPGGNPGTNVTPRNAVFIPGVAISVGTATGVALYPVLSTKVASSPDRVPKSVTVEPLTDPVNPRKEFAGMVVPFAGNVPL